MAVRRKAPKRQPRQQRARDTVEALLTATARVLVREGYENTSTNRIAAVAGVNIGSLYQYFPDKGAMVAALIDRHLETISEVLGKRLVESVSAPLRVAVRSIVTAHLEIHAVAPKLHRVLLQQVPRVARLNPILAFRARVVELVTAWLHERGVERHTANVEFTAFALVNIVDALTQAAVLERPDYLEGTVLVDGITEIIVRYLEGDVAATR